MLARKLENWLRAYAAFTDASEAPQTFNFWTGVATIAGALERKVFLDEIKFKWSPCFYIVFVAPPGIATKSSTISVGMDLLKQIEGVHFGPGSMTWQGLTAGMQDAAQLIPIGDGGQGLDGLLAQEYIAMSAITCEVSELGTFLDPRDSQLISVLIDLWDGKDKFDRWLKTEANTKVQNPWLNVLSATTPSWLRDNFPDGMIGGGLVSRIVFVFADKKRQLIPYISRVVKSDEHKQLEKELVHDLREIYKLKGEFKLTEEAYDYGGDWYINKLWGGEEEEHLKNQRFQGYKARKQTHVHKLAMVLSAAERDDLVIDKHHLEIALAIMSGIEADMLQVFDSIGKNEASQQMMELMAVLRVRKKVERPELWRLMMNSMSMKDYSLALDGLVGAGYAHIRNDYGKYYVVYAREEEEGPKREIRL